MESRKVVKNLNSLYVCIPSKMAEALKIERGDRCQFLLLPGYGLLIRKKGMDGKFPAPLEVIANLQQAADNIVHEARRKIRGMEAQITFNIWERIFGMCLKDGLLKIYPPGDGSEKPVELLPRGEEEDSQEQDR